MSGRRSAFTFLAPVPGGCRGRRARSGPVLQPVPGAVPGDYVALYPSLWGKIGNYTAWSWGVSRLIDYYAAHPEAVVSPGMSMMSSSSATDDFGAGALFASS